MSNVQLKAYKVSRIKFNNIVNGTVQLCFSNTVSHNVRYTPDSTCEATLCIEVLDKKQPDVLNISIELKGIFQIKKNVEKEFIHVDTFKELFPIGKALITTITANSGIKPIIIENIDIEEQEIYRMEMNRKPED